MIKKQNRRQSDFSVFLFHFSVFDAFLSGARLFLLRNVSICWRRKWCGWSRGGWRRGQTPEENTKQSQTNYIHNIFMKSQNQNLTFILLFYQKTSSYHSRNVGLVRLRTWLGLTCDGNKGQNHSSTEVEERCDAVISNILDGNTHTHTQWVNPVMGGGPGGGSSCSLLPWQPRWGCSCGSHSWRWSSTPGSWRSRRRRQTSPRPSGCLAGWTGRPPETTPDHQTPAGGQMHQCLGFDFIDRTQVFTNDTNWT